MLYLESQLGSSVEGQQEMPKIYITRYNISICRDKPAKELDAMTMSMKEVSKEFVPFHPNKQGNHLGIRRLEFKFPLCSKV